MECEIDHETPYLLDTPERVNWANDLREEMGVGFKWRLGDFCWYRPRLMRTLENSRT